MMGSLYAYSTMFLIADKLARAAEKGQRCCRWVADG